MIKLENEVLLVEMKTAGAELTRIFHKDTGLEYLWNADSKFWGRHSPVLFPTVGRLVEDTYLVDGKPYHLGQHGFARDRDFQVVEQTEKSVRFELDADEDSLAVYPYKFKLSIIYTIEKNTVAVSYEVENTDNKRIYFSIGAHPAFNLPLTDGTTFEDYYLDFGTEENLETLCLEGPYRSGEIKKVVDEAARYLPLNYDLFKNDALIFEALKQKEMTIKSDKTPHFVKVSFPEFPFVGVWTAKAGTPFLCIEPWYGIADGAGESVELRDKAGIEHLEPEAVFASEYEITVG
ncbi:aldose 1-epimerase family protein [Listeria monocytogenes]|jgi:Galactose mutarotase and related enzymes|uniref:Lmo1283 protein n=5 Tax=Listeria monocytogenes TaxID=1639 RepID=Q8Y7J4_LISMO|nr:aldose 1-epimerase family protein [Listeria monocytogenes]NP_464808.1 LacX protein [Listeria monocytogenes EGD-e]EAD5036001.1 aldose 1-epimerase family protein [Listeria monocytogenes serotype 1/2a]EAE3701352.1 aldose 1-epimerase family protein [Listeria monocytogenes serotype 1/2c]EAE6021158.1 aldose 1-epimerase family protein [Listeria monocytogenes serotype 3a]EAF4500424.1 aldose 1-epimerase family protein [Listeria monocytogenes serotype 4b]EAG6256795.1 aldose 1-epimerase family protei